MPSSAASNRRLNQQANASRDLGRGFFYFRMVYINFVVSIAKTKLRVN